jgi:hypothetical protein
MEDENKKYYDIKGFEGLYQINKEGSIRSLDRAVPRRGGGMVRYKGGMMTQFVNGGHLRVALSSEGKRHVKIVNELISETFLNYKASNHLRKMRGLEVSVETLKQIEDYKEMLKDKYSEETSKKTYLMKDCCNGFYKIGCSSNPERREKTLQSEKPSIVMVKVWDKYIERELHNKYESQRLRGEWFSLTKIQVRYICTHY